MGKFNDKPDMWPHMYVTYSLTHVTAEATASHTPAPCRLSPADTNRGDSLALTTAP